MYQCDIVFACLKKSPEDHLCHGAYISGNIQLFLHESGIAPQAETSQFYV